MHADAPEPERAGPGSLEALVEEFVRRREEGEELAPEVFAAEHPALHEELAAALAGLAATEGLFPDASAQELPRSIGPYRVEGEIGRGGMGRVLRVVHEERPGEPLALKLLHVGLEGNPRAEERFRREGAALERLRHPGVVRVHHIGLLGASPYLVMELVAGESLAAIVARAREASGAPEGAFAEDALPGSGPYFQRSARLVAGLARAVAAVHGAGVLHRDLKPRNVLVRPDGAPVLIDFGLVRAEDSPTLTHSGDTIGTPPYMAPEQARGERADERTDVYALGAILFELVTLTPPRRSEDTLAALREAASLPLDAPRARRPSVPTDLDTVVRRATSFRAAWRYPDAGALAADLERLLGGEPVQARPPGPLERAHDLWLRRRLPLTAAGVLLLVAAAFALPLWLRDDGDAAARLLPWVEEALDAWLAEDAERMRSATDEALELAPGHDGVRFLAALAGGELPAESRDRTVAALIAGERKRRAGDPRGALRDFQVAVNLSQTDALPRLMYGFAARDAGDFVEAEKGFSRAGRFLPRSAEVHRLLHELYVEWERPADALLAIQTALQLEPDDARLHVGLARARYELGEVEAGTAAARRALELAPDAAREELRALRGDLEADDRDRAARSLAGLLED